MTTQEKIVLNGVLLGVIIGMMAMAGFCTTPTGAVFIEWLRL